MAWARGSKVWLDWEDYWSEDNRPNTVRSVSGWPCDKLTLTRQALDWLAGSVSGGLGVGHWGTGREGGRQERSGDARAGSPLQRPALVEED